MIPDKKPNNCIMCPMMPLKSCGTTKTIRHSSGAVYVEKIPDFRCKIKDVK